MLYWCFQLLDIMAKIHKTYTTEHKKDIILSVLARKTTIQKVAAQEGIAPTLVSLWKKQAEDAIEERFKPQPRGRRKAEECPEAAAEELNKLRAELRKARTKIARLETTLDRESKRMREFNKLIESWGFRLVAQRGTKTINDQ